MMKIEIDGKDLFTWIVIIAIIIFCIAIWFKMEKVVYTANVVQNTQNIQKIADWINSQQNQQPVIKATPQPKAEVKKNGKQQQWK